MSSKRKAAAALPTSADDDADGRDNKRRKVRSIYSYDNTLWCMWWWLVEEEMLWAEESCIVEIGIRDVHDFRSNRSYDSLRFNYLVKLHQRTRSARHLTQIL